MGAARLVPLSGGPRRTHNHTNLVEQCEPLFLERFVALVAGSFSFGFDPVHFTIDLVILVREPREMGILCLEPCNEIALALEDFSQLVRGMLRH